MILDKLLIFSQNSINLTNKVLSKPMILNTYLKNNKKIIDFSILTFFLSVVGVYYCYLCLSTAIVFFKIISAITSISLFVLLVPTASTLIILLFPNHNFNLNIKIYKQKFENNKYTIEELPSPLFKKMTTKTITPSRLSVLQEKNHITEKYLNTSLDDITLNNLSEIPKSSEEVGINYDNRPEIKSGPGNIGILYFAIKYRIIQIFYLEERLETSKYKSQKEFVAIIGEQENINPGTFKGQYRQIKYTNLNTIEENHKDIIVLLFKNNEFYNYKLANDYAKTITF